MTTTFQIAAAGALLAAWAWVLGRPALSRARRYAKDRGQSKAGRADVTTEIALLDGSERDQLVDEEPVHVIDVTARHWRDYTPQALWSVRMMAPIEDRRRQRILGSAFALLASLLLTIAFRGFFVQLLILMGINAVVQLVVAAVVGRKMVAARTACRKAQAKMDVKASARAVSSMEIRAPKAGETLAKPSISSTALAAALRADSAPLPIGDDRSPTAEKSGERSTGRYVGLEASEDSPFDMAEAIASAFGNKAIDRSGVDARPQNFVSDLIDQEWGPKPGESQSSANPDSDAGDDTDGPGASDPSTKRSTKKRRAVNSRSKPLSRSEQAAKEIAEAELVKSGSDQRNRCSRKPEPIDIESTLDTDDSEQTVGQAR